MRVIETKVYKYDELSDTAKKRARQWWIELESQDYAWEGENRDTLDEFEKIFPVAIKNWSYGYPNFVNFRMTISGSFYEDDIADMKGLRLAKYIWNNYKQDLFKGKYYSTAGKWIDGKYHYKSRYSRITLDNCCVLTGYYMDDEILQPIYDFLDKPDESVTFYDLMNDCLQSWVQACEKDYEYTLSDENAEENIRANEYEFTENGKII